MRPDEEAIAEATKKTAEALQLMVTNKVAITNPSTLPTQPGGPTYIKYTPAQQGAQYASGAGERIIKMQDLPVDPLEPPKFRHTKVPRGPGSPPVPVLHSPPRKVTVQDQQNWKIPPCISNWKNAKVRMDSLHACAVGCSHAVGCNASTGAMPAWGVHAWSVRAWGMHEGGQPMRSLYHPCKG